MKLKKQETVFFLCLLLAALAAWLITSHKSAAKDYGSVTITINGEDFGTYDLGKNQEIEIPTTDLYGAAHKNVCTIKDGAAVMTEADCPDGLCMMMPAVDGNGGYICCLPHGIFIMGNPSADAKNQDTVIDGIG